VVALNYGGRAELTDACNALLEKARAEQRPDVHIDEESISAHMYTAGLPDPDLLIRTSGEMRVSNFLLWQIAYAELYVTETLWPDFSPTRLLEALVDYQKRERRYGGLGSNQAALRKQKDSPASSPIAPSEEHAEREHRPVDVARQGRL
jgi:undecaprenyl diphosphate synthase